MSAATPVEFMAPGSGHPFRVVLLDGEPWFVARDVCGALGLANLTMAMDALEEDEKGVSTVDTRGGAQQMAIISEPGLFSMVLRSRRPEAKDFRRWVTHVVLPEIRRTGQFVPQPALAADPVSASPLELAKLMLAQLERQEELLAEQQTRMAAIEVTGSHLEHQQAETIARVDQLSAKVSRRDPDDRMLEPITATTLGQLMVPPVSGMRANELLREVGMQWQQNGRWTATYDGRPYAVMVPVQHASGRMHEHLQWQRRVVDVLERKLARLRAIRQTAAIDAERQSVRT